jgi:heat shock protein HtpX
MALIKRVTLFLVVNFLVVITISFILSFFNIQPFLSHYGLDLKSLAIFCFIWGMGGAFISLGLSKIMAKWMMGVQIIDPNTRDPSMKAILELVYSLSKKAGLKAMPEVGIYPSQEVNAFATGPSQKRSLVAISSGLLTRMKPDEVAGVIGHEISHIANGDMVTMTLLQGIINAFVMFLARILAFTIARGNSKDESTSLGGMYYIMVFLFEIVFMLFGSIIVATYSRFREYRADAGGAHLTGRQNMISALKALQRTTQIQDPRSSQPAFNAFKISGTSGIAALFSSHPPLDKRIERLERTA